MSDGTFRTLKVVLALALAIFTGVGCEAPAADVCATTADCFGGESCEEGRCRRITSVDDGGRPDAGGSADTGGGARVDDCRQDGCAGSAYCDEASGECKPTCERDDQCGHNEVCGPSNTCVCPEDFHYCGETCVSDDSPATCGSRCDDPCATTDVQRALCRDARDGQGEEECILAPLPMRISTGDWHSCALTSSGEERCWGADLGDRPHLGPGPFIEITSGDSHACVLTSAGGVECWGLASEGQTSPPSDSFTQISAGDRYTCGLTIEGDVACWGATDKGQGGMRSGDFVQVSAGYEHTCALTRSGTVQCWGSPEDGAANAHEDETFLQISAGRFRTCGLTTAYTIRCWGADFPQESPTPVGLFTHVSVGGDHACAVRRGTGALVCWGAGEQGQTDELSGSFRQVSAGLEHNCALDSGGVVRCWGNDFEGQAPYEP